MTKKEHKERHIKLHQELDELIADFIDITGRRLSDTGLFEFMQWSFEQTKNPQKRKGFK